MVSRIEPVPLRGGPGDFSRRELDLWRNAQHDDSVLSICLRAGNVSVYADKLKIMAWYDPSSVHYPSDSGGVTIDIIVGALLDCLLACIITHASTVQSRSHKNTHGSGIHAKHAVNS